MCATLSIGRKIIFFPFFLFFIKTIFLLKNNAKHQKRQVFPHVCNAMHVLCMMVHTIYPRLTVQVNILNMRNKLLINLSMSTWRGDNYTWYCMMIDAHGINSHMAYLSIYLLHNILVYETQSARNYNVRWN